MGSTVSTNTPVKKEELHELHKNVPHEAPLVKVKRGRTYRNLTPVVDEIKPLVLDMVDNILTISKASMGRGASSSAKNSASLLISTFASRIVHIHELLRNMNAVHSDSLDPCVFSMADNMLGILWSVLKGKYTQTLVQLRLSLDELFINHRKTDWCIHYALHETSVLVFRHTMVLVGLVNDARSEDELNMLLSEKKRSMLKMTDDNLQRFKKSLAATKSVPNERSDIDYMMHIIEMIESSLSAVRAVDTQAILQAGNLQDRRLFPVVNGSSSPPALPAANTGSVTSPRASLSVAPLSATPLVFNNVASSRKTNSLIALNVARGGVAPEGGKQRSMSASSLKRPPSTTYLPSTSEPSVKPESVVATVSTTHSDSTADPSPVAASGLKSPSTSSPSLPVITEDRTGIDETDTKSAVSDT
jgi:hypothetical protein